MTTAGTDTKIPVILATRNAGKVREFRRLLGGDFTVEALPEGVAMAEETGSTFEENARLKARAAFEELGGRLAVLADDSGLEVAALGGKPGIHSARYAGEDASDNENVTKLLAELSGAADRSARFVCVLSLFLPPGDHQDAALVEVRGEAGGTIVDAPRGSDGFGYDPIFLPDGWTLTLGEAGVSAKDSVSHRGVAARVLITRLRQEGRLVRGY